MKKELLRINNLNLEYSVVEKLMNISICLLGGESVGFLGLENSGKNLLVDFICGKHDVDKFSYYFDGVRHINTEDLRKHVYRITVSNYLIDDWTVAEYIFLVDDSSAFSLMNRKKLVGMTEELFREFMLDIDPDKMMKKLTELEKRMVDLLKAYSNHSKIVVIEDEFEGCSTQDIEKFKTLLDRVVRHDISAVINSHSDNVSQILSDKYVIFKKGYIIKKCGKSFFSNNSSLESMLLGISASSGDEEGAETKMPRQSNSSEIIYSVSNMCLKKRIIHRLDFYKCEVVTLLSLNVKEKTEIFEMLSGRYIDKSIKIVIDKKPCTFNDIIDFVKSRVASVADMGGESELLLSMSTGNNLIIPSLAKIPALQHVFVERKVTKMLENEIRNNIKMVPKDVKNMSVNDYITLLMERWYIYRPKVLILFEPFVHCDIFGVSLVKSYIKKFTDIGTTVIIIKSREEYVEDISDRIIHIDQSFGG